MDGWQMLGQQRGHIEHWCFLHCCWTWDRDQNSGDKGATTEAQKPAHRAESARHLLLASKTVLEKRRCLKKKVGSTERVKTQSTVCWTATVHEHFATFGWTALLIEHANFIQIEKKQNHTFWRTNSFGQNQTTQKKILKQNSECVITLAMELGVN